MELVWGLLLILHGVGAGAWHERSNISHLVVRRRILCGHGGDEGLGLHDSGHEGCSRLECWRRKALDSWLVGSHWLLLYLRLSVVDHDHSGWHRSGALRRYLMDTLDLPCLGLCLSSQVFFAD